MALAWYRLKLVQRPVLTQSITTAVSLTLCWVLRCDSRDGARMGWERLAEQRQLVAPVKVAAGLRSVGGASTMAAGEGVPAESARKKRAETNTTTTMNEAIVEP